MHYDKRIELSSNRVKTTWGIIKDLMGKTTNRYQYGNKL